jgi:hypothetical protein
MPLDRVFPQKKEGVFSKKNPMAEQRTQRAIDEAVAQGAKLDAATFVAKGNEAKLMKDSGVPGNRGFHTLTVNGKETPLTGRARRKSKRYTRRR